MSPAERSAKLAQMHAGLPRNRTDEHSRNLAAANKAAWQLKKQNGVPGERVCRACSVAYVPTDWRQYYCSLDCRRLYARLTRHGITFERYGEMLATQGGVCALCKADRKGWSASYLHIDHCHKTGRVRGLLCGDCNTALGRFGDDAALLRRAADYLED